MKRSAMCCALLMTGLAMVGGCAASRKEVREEPPTPPVAPPTTAPTPPEPPAAPVAPTASPPPAAREGAKEVFPHVRVDVAEREVEIDAFVPIDAHNEKTPRVYLEVVLCSTDTKEHEALVATEAKPSHVHAALLLAGLQPGTPGAWDWEGAQIRPVPPTGPRLDVRLERPDTGESWSPAAWVVSARSGKGLAELEPEGGFMFTGSQMLTRHGVEHYRADREGCIVGLATFGGEVVGYTRLHSPESSLEEPDWMARADTVPAFGTKMIVRLRAPR
ncbi:MAG: hypothetical protein IT433_11785 [Phycisphaerales bacterium]|nr:hypothetical protein [Phycisphaerales bacterium]